MDNQVDILAEHLRSVDPETLVTWAQVEKLVGESETEKIWKRAKSLLSKDGIAFEVHEDGLYRKPPSPTSLLVNQLLEAQPGDTISWEQMEEAIGVAPKMYWKGARRALKKKGVFLSIVDGVGLRRLDGGRIVNRAVKVEIDISALSQEKRKALYQNAGLSRFAYNWGVDQCRNAGLPIGGKAGKEGRIEAIKKKERGEKVAFPKMNWAMLSREWTKASKEPDLVWTQEGIGSVPRFALKALQQAYKDAQRRISEGKRGRSIGWPRKRGKSSRRGFTIQDQSFRIQRRVTENNNVRWAIKVGKLGMYPIRNLRQNNQLDTLNGVRVNRLAFEERAGRWWCSIMYETEETDWKAPSSGKVAGLDLGYTLTIADGTDSPPVYDPPKALEKHLLWLRHWNKAMSRRYQKGKPIGEQSNRWHRAKRIVQRLHLKISHIRKDWIEWVSHDLLNKYDIIVTEGFDVGRFVSENVGHRKGRQTILDIGWGMLRSALQRKAEARGKWVELRPKTEATDQTCSQCGTRDSRADGLFRCPEKSCGHVDTRCRNTAELLYRFAMGDEPALVGEAGVNTRGVHQERSSGATLKREESAGRPRATGGVF